MKKMTLNGNKLMTKLQIIAVTLGMLAFAGNASAVEVVNLTTVKQGMHRISYEELKAEGVDLIGIRHRRLGLTLNGEPVAVRTTGQQSRALRAFFGPGGFIEFYAELADDLYTVNQSFALHVLSNREARAIRRNFGVERTQFDQTAAVATTYVQTTVVEKNNFYDFGAPSANDPWHFGQTLARRGFEGFLSFLNTDPDQRFTYDFDLSDAVDGSTASFTLEMYGLNDTNLSDTNNHHYQAFINDDQSLGTSQFKGYAADQLSGSATIREGQNSVSYKFEISEAAIDVIGLNKLTVEYQRNAIANERALQGYVDGGQLLVTNLGSDRGNVYRKTDSGLVRIVGARRSNGGTAFNTGGVAGEYIVVGSDGYALPEVAVIQDDQDIRNGSAEYLVIAHPDLMGDALDELVRLRQASYSVKVVDVNQIYAQFGNDLPSPDAIADYIKYASANLDTRFVVLIGNDTYDYKNFANSGSVSLIPTPYVVTPGGSITVSQTPSDASYGDLNDDGVPDLAVGRISARTEAELANVVAKIAVYEGDRGNYVGRILLAADRDDSGRGISFSADAESFASVIPSDWSGAIRSDFRAYPSIDGEAEARQKMLTAFNGGVSVVSYIGHSSQKSWSFTNPTMLTVSDIPNLTNIGRPAVVTQWGCWNSYYVDPQGNNMADLLMASEAGAVTVLGASTLTTSEEERALGVEINSRMYDEDKTIGEAVIEGKQALSQIGDFPAVQLGWQIIGDPALVVNN